MSEYPPEVQAVLDAALAMSDRIVQTRSPGADYGPKSQELTAAVAAYRKSIEPPEPFEVFIGYTGDNQEWIDYASESAAAFMAERVWRCTVTPIERVR